ncbi:cytochrome P450 704C1-like [Argentina anserina]|uniref:cytochrome P450 704C1-like n=1 Tax=Argentina anserina TaxID=57926 RepID=UPI0021766C32|nr:cytochrome P450 704C1-like [Potentilla anserina]
MDFASTALALSLVLVLAVGVARHHGRRLRDKNKRYHPVVGTVVHQVIYFPRIHHYMTELACKYKTYRIFDLFQGAIYTADPANVEYVLKTNFCNYGKGSYTYSIISDVVGDGIFSVDGQKWQHQRKMMSAEFSTKVVRDFSAAVSKTNAVKLAGIIYEAATSNQAIEIQDLFMKATLDSTIKILLGIELDSMSGTDEEGNRFSHAFESQQEAALYRIFDKLWKIKRFLNIGKEAELKKNIEVVDQFVYKLINSKIESIKNPENNLSLNKKRDLVSRRLELKDTDPKYLRDIVLCVTVAGQDTTATSLSWFVYMMCKHPHIQEKIAMEVREVTNLMRDNSSVDELEPSLTDEALNKMQYLHAALTETLRLYPVVPMNIRMCFSDDTWPDGFSVNKGDMVIYLPYAMGRMTSIWGDDAEEFRPERWLDENGIFHDESPCKFIAFSAGPRICLGKEHAYMQMKILSAVLLGSYVFKLADEKKTVSYKTMVTLPIDGGLYVNASPRV